MHSTPAGRMLLLLVLWGSVPRGRLEAADSAAELAAVRGQLAQQYTERLEQLAERCRELQMPEQEQATRAWIVRRDPLRQYLFLPPAVPEPLPAAGASPQVMSWHNRFRQLRSARAAELFDLARRAIESRQGALAYQLLFEILREDPDHPEARRILGYRQLAGRWDDAARRPRSQAGSATHPTWGWRRGSYWKIDSEHFRITTNQSAKAGLELAELLENFTDVWQQVFFAYWSSADRLAARFAGEEVALAPERRHELILFRDREEYLQRLSRAEPQIAISLGYYLDSRRTSFFYGGDAGLRANWLHEVTHQLFQESIATAPRVGGSSNFWIVEGVAQYLESYSPREGYCTVGGLDADRLQYARARALSGEFFLPFAELIRLDRDSLQRDEHIRRIYSQAAGMTHFLLDADGGKYREATLRYLQAVYTGRAELSSLAESTGATLEELEAAYRRYLQVTDAALAQCDLRPGIQNLALGHTAVTNAGLAALRGVEALQWLDLSHTPVDEKGLAVFASALGLRQLNLERTAITDAALETIGRWRQLEELDLSQTRITDAALPQLAELRELKVLYLTGTSITDRGLPALEPLRKLELLQLDQTAVSDEARRRLQQRLPALNEER